MCGIGYPHSMPLRGPRRLILPALGLLILASGRRSTIGAPASPPNVLVIVTDDQRAAGTLSVMPRTRRWFRRGGTQFSNAFATTPQCCPSRSTIMTGRFAHNTGVHNNFEAMNLDQATTMQAYLHREGYLTAFDGKFLNEWPREVAPPFFDRWATWGGGYLGGTFNVDGRLRHFERHTTDFLADRALSDLQWFEQDDERPWLLYITPWAPHGPPRPPARHAQARVPPWVPGASVRETNRSDKPGFIRSRETTVAEQRIFRRDQLRTLRAVDDLVGQVMNRLRELGEGRRTVAFFLSDNGRFWGDHGLKGKAMPYTDSVRIPFLVRWPGRVPAGDVADRLVGTIDVAPTVLEAAGTSDLVEPLDGRSLLGSHERDRILLEYWTNPATQTAHIPEWASLRTPTEQYVEYYDESGDVTFREYYDLVADAPQVRNVLGDDHRANDPPDVARLSRLLASDRSCRGTDTADAGSASSAFHTACP